MMPTMAKNNPPIWDEVWKYTEDQNTYRFIFVFDPDDSGNHQVRGDELNYPKKNGKVAEPKNSSFFKREFASLEEAEAAAKELLEQLVSEGWNKYEGRR